MRFQDHSLARAQHGGRSSMIEHLVVTQVVVGSNPTVRPDVEWISFRHVCQGSSAVEHLAFSICVPCLAGSNSSLGRGSMVTGQWERWFESSPWRWIFEHISSGWLNRRAGVRRLPPLFGSSCAHDLPAGSNFTASFDCGKGRLRSGRLTPQKRRYRT